MLDFKKIPSEYYRVKERQTLFQVSEEFSVPPQKIIAENHLTHWQSGLVLHLPPPEPLSEVVAGESLEGLGGTRFAEKNGSNLVYPTLPVWRIEEEKHIMK